MGHQDGLKRLPYEKDLRGLDQIVVKYGTSLFTEVHRLRTRDNDHVLKQERLPKDVREKICFLWG